MFNKSKKILYSAKVIKKNGIMVLNEQCSFCMQTD